MQKLNSTNPFNYSVLSNQEYTSLPKYPARNMGSLKKILVTLGEVSLILPFIHLVKCIFSHINSENTTFSSMKHLSFLARTRLSEMETRVHHLAMKCGATHPKKIKVFVGGLDSDCRAAGFLPGQGSIRIPALMLVKPEDLPQELKLENLHEIKEEEWIEKFEAWICQEFAPEPRPASKYYVDDRKLIIKEWLNLNRKHPNLYNQTIDFSLAHEIGHLVLKHHLKFSLAFIAYQLLFIPSFGLSRRYQDKVFLKLSRKFEKEADLFSAEKTGSSHPGIKLCKKTIKRRKKLSLEYFEELSKEGEFRFFKTHPPIYQRIKYLKNMV